MAVRKWVTHTSDELIAEQVRYYDARAKEYNDAYERRGQHDRGESHNAQWLAELSHVERALREFDPRGTVLEVACGTGHWTGLLSKTAASLTALDASLGMLEVARESVIGGSHVRFVHADVFSWKPAERFDVVFFAFFLSHVPPGRFADFWRFVDASLKPGGRVFVVDGPLTRSSAKQLRIVDGAPVEMRRLRDGREFRAVKVVLRRKELSEALETLGWKPMIKETETFFVYGEVTTGGG